MRRGMKSWLERSGAGDTPHHRGRLIKSTVRGVDDRSMCCLLVEEFPLETMLKKEARQNVKGTNTLDSD